MARRVFFSFHYKYVWKVNQIRSIPNVTGTAAAGFHDASLWEEAKEKGDKKIKGMIDEALERTSVTVVFITYGTKDRTYIDYEIDQSLARGNGLVAVQIHHLKDRNGSTGSPGAIPSQIERNGFKAYKYTNSEDLSDWIEEAAKLAGK
ncbi:MAG: TIR domain-containing protein [Alcanivorax sp.]|nr:MAG: TIR domain-containing protein [Alcanivorax sp.]